MKPVVDSCLSTVEDVICNPVPLDIWLEYTMSKLYLVPDYSIPGKEEEVEKQINDTVSVFGDTIRNLFLFMYNRFAKLKKRLHFKMRNDMI